MRYFPSTLSSKPRRMECESCTQPIDFDWCILIIIRTHMKQNCVLYRITDSVGENLERHQVLFGEGITCDTLIYERAATIPRSNRGWCFTFNCLWCRAFASSLCKNLSKFLFRQWHFSWSEFLTICWLLFSLPLQWNFRGFFICKHGRKNMESHAINTIRFPRIITIRISIRLWQGFRW